MKNFWKNLPAAAGCVAAAGKLLVTLDFDGTLAALAESPGEASLTARFRSALKELSSSPGVSVFILSGRSLESVSRLVALRGLFYGGNHGIEIKGPGLSWKASAAVKAKERLSAIAAELAERFPPGTGVLVENKRFSVSVHYRNIKPAYKLGFFGRMRALMRPVRGPLYWRRGHRVFELLPRGAAHKGDAVELLARRLKPACILAVGDDLTDEDMFRTLAGRGITIRVGRKTASGAEYYLARQGEVLRLLKFILASRRMR